MWQIKKSQLRQLNELDVELINIKTVARWGAEKKRKYVVTFRVDISVSKEHEIIKLECPEATFESILLTIKNYLNDSERVYQEPTFVSFEL